MARDVWGVSVRHEDQDPETYGPYTRKQAERVAARLREEALLATSTTGLNYHPHLVLDARAIPLARYEAFLTGDERRQARGAARRDER